MPRYCLWLSSEHFYLQKMTELALFIMHVSKPATLYTPLGLTYSNKGMVLGVYLNAG